jgi:hypothetical protein
VSSGVQDFSKLSGPFSLGWEKLSEFLSEQLFYLKQNMSSILGNCLYKIKW